MGHERLIRSSIEACRPQLALDPDPFHRYVLEDETVWTEFYRLGDGYLLRFPDLADFEITSDGKNVTAYPAEDVDSETVEHLFINQIVPLALSRQGRPAFHASVVTVPGGAVAFLGRSGMGKSTLAASFALNDSEFLTDDSLLIEETADGCLALPSHASVRLWEDSVEALSGEEISRASSLCYTDKARLLAGEALTFCDQPTGLLAAYVLEKKDVPDLRISPLMGGERTMSWVENSFLLDIEDQGLLAEHFDWTNRIAGTVPSFRLDYPRDYGILAEVRDEIRAHLASI